MVEKGSLRLHLPSWYLYLELQTPVPLVSISVDAIVLKNTCKCQHGLYLLCQSERMREWDFFFLPLEVTFKVTLKQTPLPCYFVAVMLV